MLFHITKTHTPENCPKDVGGSETLYNPKVEAVKLRRCMVRSPST